MRSTIALLLTLSLSGCERESLMEHSGERLDDLSEEITTTLEESREDVEGSIVEEAAD